MVSYQNPHLYNGRYRALVIDDRDPLFRMRVKVRIPDLMVAEEDFVGKWDTNGVWAFPANNYLGGRSVQDTQIRMKAPEAYYQGSCLIPPKGSHVWIIFEKGDISHPFYTGSAEYGDCVAPPENQVGKEYQKKWTLLKTPDGKCLIASDDPSDARWELTGKKRQIKNPPFGDIDSVYQIDGNQTVFLIDEREGHEKVLLKDYTGNFMKLVQDENEDAGKFFMHTNNDMEIDCGGNFYLTVTGDIHVRAQNIYVTAVNSIFTKAYEQLKEYAKSFDRYSNVYDRTMSGSVDISGSEINLQAATRIYQTSILNIRNCYTISDDAAANINLMAGGYISLTAAGKVITHGGAGTAIQTPDPIMEPISNSISYPSYPTDALLALPDGERYQDIETDRDPILNLEPGKDSLKGFKIKHDPVPYTQEAKAVVGRDSNSSGSSSSNSSSGSSGGSSSDAANSSESSSGDSSSFSDGNSSNNSSSDSSNSSNSSSSSSSSESSSSESSGGDSVSGSGSCSGGTVLSDITEDMGEELESEVYSYNGASQNLNTQVLEFTNNLRDYTYGRISGIGIGAGIGTGIGVGIGAGFYAGVGTYNLDNYWNVRSGALVTNQKWYNTSMDSCYQKVCDCLVYDVEYDCLSCKETMDKIYKDIDGDYSYLINEFIEKLKETLRNNLPNSLSSYIVLMITSSAYDCFEGIMSTRKKGKSVAEYLYNCINNFCYNAVSKVITDVLNTDYIDFQNRIADILSKSKKIVDNDKKEYSTKFVNQVTDKINKSTDNLKTKLVSATKINVTNDKLIDSDSIAKCIESIRRESNKLVNKFNESIEEFKENSDLIDELINELVDRCREILDNSVLTDDQIDRVSNEISTTFNKKITDALYDIEKFSIADNIFYSSFEKINSSFETLSFNILKVYDTFKVNLIRKYSDRIFEIVYNDVSSIVTDIDSYSTLHPENTTVVTSTLRAKINELMEAVKTSISKDGLLKNAVSETEIDEIVEDFKSKLKAAFSTSDNDMISDQINESLNDTVVSIEKKRKSVLNNSIRVEDNKTNTFSKYNAIDYKTVPNDIGFGYKYLLFLNDKYRKTIAPLVVKSGGNVLAFDIMLNTSLIDESSIYFINKDVATDYNKIFSNLDEIDTTTIWWTNLKEIANQCAILGIKMVITLCDFRDDTNPFILNKTKKYVYTDKGWDDNIQGKFFKTIFDVISQYGGEVIYNIGRGSYDNPYDTDHKIYNMYPNCGYIRKLITHFVYTGGITSNYLSLTANENDNLYYYSPYTEYHSFDDNASHELDEHSVLIHDYIDNKVNDNADIVNYKSDGSIGGYAGYLIKCHKDSVAIFNMDNLSSHIPLGADVTDPNIMNAIFCKHSREAVRYFKTKDYFETTGSLEFDITGEVK